MEKQELAKIAISTDADQALTGALETVNRDNHGGRVTKANLASWFIQRSALALSSGVIAEVQAAYFDQVAYLEGVVKRLKSSGEETLSSDETERLKSILKGASRQARGRRRKTIPARTDIIE